ncbi:MAG: hypothetical protein Q4E75_00510 [bacterium]|nr:hypothetical protein [bacterium]
MKKKRLQTEGDNMVNYWLTCLDNKQLKMIELNDIINDKRISTLDEFTSKFKSKEELKSFLIKNNYIDSSFLKSDICIIYKANKKINYLEVLYGNMKKYTEYDYLLHTMYSLTSDVDFLNKLIERYSMVNQRFNTQFSNILSLRYYVNVLKSDQVNDDLRENVYYIIENIIKKATTKSSDLKIEGYKENYRGLRDLGLFVYGYINKKEKQIKKYNNKEKTDNDYKNHMNMTFESLDSELLFPPNSSEEDMYLKYLDELESIAEEETIIDDKGHPYCR